MAPVGELVVGAAHFDVSCTRVGADRGQKTGEFDAAAVSNGVRSFDAKVARVVGYLRKLSNLFERVVARPLNQSCDRKGPPIQINSRIKQ